MYPENNLFNSCNETAINDNFICKFLESSKNVDGSKNITVQIVLNNDKENIIPTNPTLNSNETKNNIENEIGPFNLTEYRSILPFCISKKHMKIQEQKKSMILMESIRLVSCFWIFLIKPSVH